MKRSTAKIFGIFLLSLFSSFSFGSDLGDIKLPTPEIETLKNGLKIVWFVDQKLPVIDMGFLFLEGSKNDPKGKSGCASLTGAALERGAGGKSNLEFARAFEQKGGSFGVSVDDDSTSLSIHGLSKDADHYLDLLSDVILKPNFYDKEILDLKIKENDRFQHLGDSTENLASYAFGKWISSGTPYSRGQIESIKEFNSVTPEDIRQFYKKTYTPNHAYLMIVGRVDKETFRKKLIQKFGNWENPKTNFENKTFVTSQWKTPKTKILIINRPDLPQAQVRFGFKIPSIHSKNRYALAVGNSILGEYFNSRLNSVIRDELGLAYGIGSNLNYSKDFAFLSISSATALQHVPVMIRETTRILDNFKKGMISYEEVDVAKNYLIGGYPLSVSTLGSVASRWLAGVAYELGPDFLNEFVPKVNSVTRDEVISAVKEAFNLDELKIVIAGDSKTLVPLLKKFQFNSVEVREADSLLK